ncbi:MAG: circularly permuted type 2 ATP-grasp protein, partial [Chromatiales bacterium]|nr:circularly permuted type 2 ATP-grasp protein [Chromatiales bacterium]
MKKKWEDYRAPGYFDELITEQGNPRIAARKLVNHFSKLSDAEMSEFFAAAELAIREMGISFTVYSEGSNIDRSWPMDIIPRIIRASDWRRVSAGLIQRSKALNAFINDIYNRQKILADGVIPAEIVL